MDKFFIILGQDIMDKLLIILGTDIWILFITLG